MSIKLKQYLENSWYRWASQDRQSWYAAQFQYWENVNIRDMRNGVCLSWGATDIRTNSNEFSYFTASILWKTTLFMVDTAWDVYNVESGAQVCNINKTFTYAPIWMQFWDDVYIIWTAWVFKCTLQSGTRPHTDITPWGFIWDVHCALNYANTFLLIWDLNMVWRMSIETWTPIFKDIREFDKSYVVYWLTQEWNYLKIYVTDWANTKIHYAKGTFDVEYTWLIQTVSFNWLYIMDWCVTSDQWVDYALFNFAEWELKLAKISWYSKTDIRWTQTWDNQKVFTGTEPKIMSSDWVLFAATDEWIWTFTEYNGWLWWGCIEFKESKPIKSLFRFWEKLYVCIKNSNSSYYVRYYDLSFHPAKYQSSWFLIGRVFDGWCAGLFKKNDQATITYNMPSGTNMELSYRYDRDSFGYNKSNFYSIKKLTDTTNCYDIVVPTTPQVDKQESLLRKEEANDLILLENWNWILLEDMMVCPFNKTWNLLEYRFDLHTNNTSKTPTLYEHSLTYYDYMRKYR